MIRFFFLISNNIGGYKELEICEPIGFDASSWGLKQDTGRYGRDVLFSPDSFTFSPFVEIQGLTHQFNALISVYKEKGFEGDVRFKIEIGGIEYVLGQLDFKTAETDCLKYFTCNIIQLNDEATFKRRKDVKVDLFSNKDYDGNDIVPLTPEKILLKALPLTKVSEWTMAQNVTIIGGTPAVFFNPAPQIIKSEIKDTLSPSSFVLQTGNNNSESLQDYAILQASTRIVNGILKVRNGAWSTATNLGFALVLRKGYDIATSEIIYNEVMNDVETDFSVDISIPVLNQSERLFFYFIFQDNTFPFNLDFTSFDYSLEVTTLSYNSLTNGVRLIDAIKQIVTSISGLTVTAPLFESGGEHYDQYIFKGNEIRFVEGKPFTLSFEDVLKYLPEVNCDYQINGDGTIFIGHEIDFYVNQKAGDFETPPNSNYKETINEKLTFNKINYEYTKFEEGATGNIKDALNGVNTAFEMTTPNLFVEDTLDIKVGFIRDAYLIENVREKYIGVTESAPTENDEDVFIIDVIQKEFISQLETFFVNQKEGNNDTLEILNDGSFKWSLLGFFVGQEVSVTGDNNPGIYNVTEIENGRMLLTRTASGTNFTGLGLITINWLLQTNKVNRTDEGFNYVLKNNEPIFPFANLKYSAKRNLQKYYRHKIRSASQFYPSGVIKNTFFRNGGDVQALFNNELNLTLGKQNRDILVNNLGLPLLSAFTVEVEVICDFPKFWQTLTQVRNEKKYIEVEDTKGNLVKLHPIEMYFSFQDNILTIIGERRWQ